MTTQILNLPRVYFTAEVTSNGEWIDRLAFLSLSTQRLLQAGVFVGGSGYADGDHSLTLIGGAGTPAVVTGRGAGGAIVAVTGIVAVGAYSMLPASPAPVSGGAGTGCQIAGQFNGAPIDLTGIDFRMMARATIDSHPIIDASITNGHLVNSGGDGTLGIQVPLAANMENFKGYSSAVCDIVAMADGHTVVVGAGTLTITPGVTRTP